MPEYTAPINSVASHCVQFNLTYEPLLTVFITATVKVHVQRVWTHDYNAIHGIVYNIIGGPNTEISALWVRLSVRESASPVRVLH